MNEYKPYPSKEVENKIIELSDKILKSNYIKDYNGKEQALIKTAYWQQGVAYTGKPKNLANGCSSCFKDAINLIRNHINMYNSRRVEPVVKVLKKKTKPAPLETFEPKTYKEYLAALRHLGVPVSKGLKKAELIDLWEKNC